MYNKKSFLILIIVNIVFIIIFWLLLTKFYKRETIIQRQDFESKITSLSEILPQSVVNIFSDTSMNYYMENDWDSAWVIQKQSKLWWASGIIWSKDWYIITNKHVVEDKTVNYSVVSSDWSIYKIDKIRFVDGLDIAVVHIVDKKWNSPKNLNVPKFISSKDNVNVWQFVLAIWNAFSEYNNTVSFGMISAKNRKLDLESNIVYTWLYQVDISIYPGNSWWPIFDTKWEVIGMVTAMSRGGNNIWFAIPLNTELVDKMILESK